MESKLKPIRRVVTANDARGRSRAVWDGPAPNTHEPTARRNGYTDLWVWDETPLPLARDSDDGNLPYDFPGSRTGGHLRVIQSRERPVHYDVSSDESAIPAHAPQAAAGGRTWDRGGRNAYSSDMHKTETIDYAILLEGERILVLDDCELAIHPGDVLVQVGAWHQWSSRGPNGLMAFDMIAARFADGPSGLAQGHDRVLPPLSREALPSDIAPTRRIVTVDREPGKSTLITDGPSPDIRTDPARPGFASTRLWVIDSAPAKIVCETLHLPHTIQPPPSGSVLRVLSLPPDANWKRNLGKREVEAFFASMGSPQASTYSPQAPHPYMQKTRTVDFCFLLKGELTLILDTHEVSLAAGDVVVQRATNHAWSNRGVESASLVIASHDAI
jgi:mannose-6-phosphate isomerase-like protein (cupin superfamily)